ncbi:hypothetical protein ACSDR0_13590 [Streptosporangium sp. G11]
MNGTGPFRAGDPASAEPPECPLEIAGRPETDRWPAHDLPAR